MRVNFSDRHDAGRRMGARLQLYAARPDLIVLGLPRGGVLVAEEIARHLHAPLDVLIVRKLGLPGDEELAIGAIGGHGVRVLNRDVVDDFGVPASAIERVAAKEQRELARREAVYREGRPPLELQGRTVILVDDGVATGSSMRAAIAIARADRPGRLVVAVPVIAREAYFELRGKVDDLVALHIPKEFLAVGAFYADFRQVTDEEVCESLAHAVA